jgi:hypothetical protein
MLVPEAPAAPAELKRLIEKLVPVAEERGRPRVNWCTVPGIATGIAIAGASLPEAVMATVER